MAIKNRPLEIALVTIIGADDVEVSTNDYSATADLDLGQTYGATVVRPCSGYIEHIKLVASCTGTGAPPDEPGWLFFFDIDPNTTSGDVALGLVDHNAVISQVRFAAADWNVADANGATACRSVSIPFHSLRWLYVVYRNLGAAINDAGADDEILCVQIHYRRQD